MNQTGSQYGQAGSPPNNQFHFAIPQGQRRSINTSQQKIYSQPQYSPQGTLFQQWGIQSHGGYGSSQNSTGVHHAGPSDEHLLSDIQAPDSATIGQYGIQDFIRPVDEGLSRINNLSIQGAHLPNYCVAPQQRTGAAYSDPVPGDGYAATLSDGYSSQDHAYDSAIASLPPTAGLVDRHTFAVPPHPTGYFPTQDVNLSPYQSRHADGSSGAHSTKSDTYLQAPAQASARSNKRKRPAQVEPCNYINCIYQPKNASEAKKHENTHLKRHKCEVEGCDHAREGFATPNDLERHRNGVHGLTPRKGPAHGFICIECMRIGDEKATKWWPRKDNFKNHIVRKHINRHLSIERLQEETELIINGSRRPISQRPNESTTDRGSVYSAGGNSGYMSRQASQMGVDHAGQCYPITESGAPDSDPLLPTFMPQSSSQQGDYLPETAFTSYDLGLQDVNSGILNDLTLQPRGSGAGFHGSFDNECDGPEPQRLAIPSDVASSLPAHEQTYDAFDEPAPKRPRLSLTNHDTSTLHPIHPQHPPSNGWNSQPQNFPAPYIPPPPKGSIDGKFPCPWQGCKKIKSRECDLTKHHKRHTRPYGCTFHACSKRFGSRNDWKRHESSQHYHRHGEQWLCVCTRPDGNQCRRTAATEGTMREHVRSAHGVLDTAMGWVKLGAAGQESYWCGFCEQAVAVEVQPCGELSEVVDAWDVRAKHIGDHYDHGGCFGADWWCLEKRGKKGGPRGENDNSSKGADGRGRCSEQAEDSDLGEDGIPSTWDRGRRRRAIVGAVDDVVMGNGQAQDGMMMYDA